MLHFRTWVTSLLALQQLAAWFCREAAAVEYNRLMRAESLEATPVTTSGISLTEPAESGEWKIHEEDERYFCKLIYKGTDDWYGGHSKCGTFGTILGGFNKAGQHTILNRTYEVPAGVSLKVEMKFVKIDNWKGKEAVVAINGERCWEMRFQGVDGEQVCGQSREDYNEMMVNVSCVTVTNFTRMTVSVYTTLSVDPSAASFGIKDPEVWELLTACPKDICDDGKIIKPGFPTCDGDCTPTGCCDDRGQCKEHICEEGEILKENVPGHCVAQECLKEECCEPLPQCAEDTCNQEDGYVLKQMLPMFCTERECREKECCDLLPECSLKYCPLEEGFNLKAEKDLPTRCAAVACTAEECCLSLPPCRLDVCYNFHTLKQGQPIYCPEGKCTDPECCEPLCESVPCTLPLRPKSHPPLNCIDIPCQQHECCESPHQVQAGANMSNETTKTSVAFNSTDNGTFSKSGVNRGGPTRLPAAALLAVLAAALARLSF